MQAQSADGVIHDFPDGTDISVIDRVMKSYAADAPKPADGPGVAPQAVPEQAPAPAREMTPQQMYGGSEPAGEAAALSASPTPPGAGSRILSAAEEGWRGGGFQTPEVADRASAENQQTWVGRNLIEPAVSLSNVPFRAMGAVGGGLSQAAVEAGTAVGRPELGRDLNMLAQVAPMAHVPGVSLESAGAGVKQALNPIAAIGAATDVNEAIAAAGAAAKAPIGDVGAALAPAESPQLRLLRQTEGAILRRVDGDETRLTPTEGVRLDNLRTKMADMQGPGPAEDIPTVTVTAPATEPALPAGTDLTVPEPQSVGAAASSRDMTPQGVFGRSAREMKGQHADMELADLMRTPEPGDKRDIIPGATQTRAEIELSPSVSRTAKGLRQEFREGWNDHEKENNELYHTWVDTVVPDREQVGTMKDVREATWQNDERTVFGPKSEGEIANAAPVVQHISDVFADPVEKHNSYLKSAFQPFLDKLIDDNGAPLDIGAKELYGIRQEMSRKVKDMATNTDLAHVRDQFRKLMDVVDSTIASAAPDYRTMMDHYSEASGPINAGERLQDMKLKISNGPDRMITFGAFDRYMKNLWLERHGPNPYAPAKSIPQETWDHLMLLHERLARSASDQELAKTRGSDTTQMMMEMMRKGAIGAAHAVVGGLTHGLGNVAIPFVTRQIDQGLAARQIRQHLNPDLSRYPTPGP